MQVSCIIPAYNEAATIPAVVRAARACPEVDEVIVVSDGSTDETARRAADAGADRVIVLRRNQGKGNAVARAAREARGEVLLLLDADLRGLRPAHLTRLLAPVLHGQADMAVALFTEDRLHRWLSRLSGQRALRRHLLRPEVLSGTGFGLEVALDRWARRAGARVVRVRMSGVTHRRKRDKYGTMKGLRLQVRASSDLLRQARKAVPRPDPRRWITRRRSPPMAPLLLVVLIALALATPLLASRPPRAAAGRFPTLEPAGPQDRILAVVAHPDDEVLGAGGFLHEAHRAGAQVTVLVLTLGDANRVSAAVRGRRVRPTPQDFRAVGTQRQAETRRALQALGLPPDAARFLGFPDRALALVADGAGAADAPAVRSRYTALDRAAYPAVLEPEAPYTAAALDRLVARVAREVRPTLVVTHAPLDRHPDHRAAFALAVRHRGTAPVITFVVHVPGFPRPLWASPGQPLLPPPGEVLPAGWTWAQFPLGAEARRRKATALRVYQSQRVSPYLRLLLAGFVRSTELFALPPAE